LTIRYYHWNHASKPMGSRKPISQREGDHSIKRPRWRPAQTSLSFAHCKERQGTRYRSDRMQ
jgi:hypothetical protein